MDTGISWVRSHIGIPGNEAVDRAAEFQSFLGPVAGSPNITTFEGLRAHGKAIRKEARSQPGFGMGNRPMWNRRSLSAYTWMRSNRGPQLEWLHKIRKTDSLLCPCGAIQSGDHIVFECPQHHTARQALGTGQHRPHMGDPRRTSIPAQRPQHKRRGGANGHGGGIFRLYLCTLLLMFPSFHELGNRI